MLLITISIAFPPECWKNFDYIINCTLEPYTPNEIIPSPPYNKNYLQLPIHEGKKGQNILYLSIPIALKFIKKPLEENKKILINISESYKEDDDTVGHYDSEELERITYSLRDELSELDAIEKVDLVAKAGELPPEGSKAGAEVAELGSLLVTMAASAGSALIPNIANALQSWLTRHERHKISLEIGGDKLEVTGISDNEQHRLIDAWIGTHIEKKKQFEDK